MLSRLDHLVRTWARIFGLLRAASPALSIAVTLTTLVEAVTGIGMLYLIKLLVDAISENMKALQPDVLGQILPVLLLTGGAIVATVFMQNVGSILRMRQNMAITEYVDQQIHDRAISVDLQFYESPQYYDALARARQGGAQRPAQIISNVVSTFRAAIMLAGIFLLLAGIDLLLVPILLLPVVIVLFVRLHYAKKLFDWRMAKAQLERRTGYFDWMLTSAVHAKELRLNRIGPFFQDQYRTLKGQIREGHVRIEQARLWTEFAVAILGAGVLIAASAWLLQQSLTQQRPIGDVVLFVLLLRRAESGGNELVGNVSRIADDHLYMKSFFDFLAIEPVITTPTSPLPIPSQILGGVRLSNVSFKYDGAMDFALHNISLTIRPGQIVALVGENGSGKTTLIKLLTRLYDPTEGSISLEGTDIRQFDPDSYRRLFSVIFQDFAMYAETVGNNIRFGDVNLPSNPPTTSGAAARAGAASFIERLPQSYDTLLTKLFDGGQDLSIGQWQRLALARAFYPDSKFVILDEPTSAVDPKAEFELFENFRQRIAGRGALVISHRLSTIRQADYTYFLREGRIIEHGPHVDLMAAHGQYAELFKKQAQSYRS